MEKVVTLDRMEFARRNRDPWRLECPEGHVSVRLNSSGIHVRHRGIHSWQERSEEYSNGRDYEGPVHCKTCNESYRYAYDKKEDVDVTIETADDVGPARGQYYDPSLRK